MTTVKIWIPAFAGMTRLCTPFILPGYQATSVDFAPASAVAGDELGTNGFVYSHPHLIICFGA